MVYYHFFCPVYFCIKSLPSHLHRSPFEGRLTHHGSQLHHFIPFSVAWWTEKVELHFSRLSSLTFLFFFFPFQYFPALYLSRYSSLTFIFFFLSISIISLSIRFTQFISDFIYFPFLPCFFFPLSVIYIITPWVRQLSTAFSFTQYHSFYFFRGEATHKGQGYYFILLCISTYT